MQRAISIILSLLPFLCFLPGRVSSQERYTLHYRFTGKDTLLPLHKPDLETSFRNQSACENYIGELEGVFRKMGYLSVSLDSIAYERNAATAWVYTGKRYVWGQFRLPDDPEKLLQSAGWDFKPSAGKPVDLGSMDRAKEKLLIYLENNGYPFSAVRMDSILFEDGILNAGLLIEKGPLYRIDSIRITGGLRISPDFLQRYLDIRHGGIYRKDRLEQVSRRLLELPYLKESRPWDITMLGTGATLNLYLESRKSSQVNMLVGFLPDNPQKGGKLLLTGEGNVNLRNALGGGETIMANWQQLQVQSPRLNLGFTKPYIFRSPVGLDFNFDLYKKDSSFLNLNTRVGIQYLVTPRQSGRLFYHHMVTNLLTIDTNQVKKSLQLPPYMDVSSSALGVDYQFNSTDYRYNPRSGSELGIVFSGGLRKIKPNLQITQLTTDASGKPFDFGSLYDTLDTRQFVIRLKGGASHFFKTSRQSTLKASIQGGMILTPDVFRNEIFQIGGYRLLRGFDEESIFTSQYAVGTMEYRYLTGLNSFLFAFADIGLAGNSSYKEDVSHSYLGFGMGMTFETKAGVFNISYAMGKRDDQRLDPRQSKIHFGFISLF